MIVDKLVEGVIKGTAKAVVKVGGAAALGVAAIGAGVVELGVEGAKAAAEGLNNGVSVIREKSNDAKEQKKFNLKAIVEDSKFKLNYYAEIKEEAYGTSFEVRDEQGVYFGDVRVYCKNYIFSKIVLLDESSTEIGEVIREVEGKNTVYKFMLNDKQVGVVRPNATSEYGFDLYCNNLRYKADARGTISYIDKIGRTIVKSVKTCDNGRVIEFQKKEENSLNVLLAIGLPCIIYDAAIN